LHQVIGKSPNPVAGFGGKGDFLFAQVEENVSGRYAEDDAFDVDHAGVGHLQEKQHHNDLFLM
jgi:hypothetical protein